MMISRPATVIMLSLVVLVLAVVASVQGKCDKGCAVSVEAYEEMGCEPVFAKPDDCCPSHYNCAKLEGRAADKCFVKGKAYNKGDKIESDITEPNCLAGCFCSKNEWQEFTCAHIDCPEFFGGRLQPGCYFAYELNSCCKTKTVCPPFDKLPKCEVDGKTYYEGQKFYSQDEKLKCVCKEGFTGKLEAPFCARVSCGVEILHSKDFRSKCAPVFYGSRGCPIQWECLKDGDVVVPNQKGTTSEQKCSYGEKKLNIGDKLLLNQSTSSPKIDCECKIPPLITCIQRPYEN